jgi:glycosyltransferase involved in cell wall biosynthesis
VIVDKPPLPKVSIMMLCHTGRGRLLVRAVQSVLVQTYPNWELVIQDDCSEDFTYDIAKLLAQKDSRIRVYRNQIRLGAPKNRAAAIKNMTGDLLCHVDSDDFIYPHALTTMVEVFLKNPSIGFAYSDMAYGDETGKVTSYRLNEEPVLGQKCQGWRSFGMYTRKAYTQTNGYNTKLEHTCEDGDLVTQIAAKFPIVRVGHVLYWANNTAGADHVTLNHKIDCATCPCRPDCNYAKAYADWVGYNLDTWKKET